MQTQTAALANHTGSSGGKMASQYCRLMGQNGWTIIAFPLLHQSLDVSHYSSAAPAIPEETNS